LRVRRVPLRAGSNCDPVPPGNHWRLHPVSRGLPGTAADAKKAVWVQTACVERGDGKFEVSGFYAQEGAAYAAKDARQGASDARAEQTTGGGVLGTLHARKGEKKAHQHRRKDDAAYTSFFSLDRA